MPKVKNSLGEGTQSVLLTITILERLARTPGPVGISELSREIDTSKSRIFRHLQTLAGCDFVRRSRVTGGYEAGHRLLELCQAMNRKHDFAEVAMPHLEELAQTTGHTAIISRVDPIGVQVLKSMSGDSGIVLDVRAGTMLPFVNSAQGLIALAFAPPAWREAKGPLADALEVTGRRDPGLLDRIVSEGWSEAQMREGLLGTAAPIFDPGGTLIGTLGLLDTVAAMTAGKAATIQALRAAAANIGRDLRQDAPGTA